MFAYLLVTADGDHVAEMKFAVSDWSPGNTISLGPGKQYVVVDRREPPTDRDDLTGVLVVATR